MLRSWCTLHRPAILGCLWMAGLLARFPRWRNLSNPTFRGDADDSGLSAECLNRPTRRGSVRLAPWRSDRHRTHRATRLRSPRSVAGGAHCDDHAALAANLSSARSRSGDVSRPVAFRSMVCGSGRAAIHACPGDLLRGAEPFGQQPAAIPCAVLSCVSGSLNWSLVPSRLLWR